MHEFGGGSGDSCVEHSSHSLLIPSRPPRRRSVPYTEQLSRKGHHSIQMSSATSPTHPFVFLSYAEKNYVGCL